MTTKRFLAATTAALVLTAVPAAAQSDEPAVLPGTGDRCVPDARIDEARARILDAIDRRLATVERLGGAVERARSLTDDHRSTIEATLAATSGGLTDLRSTVEGEDDGCELADEARTVVDDLRVFVVVAPQTRLAIGADRVAGADDKLDAVEGRLQRAIDDAAAAGQDVAEAEAALGSFVAAGDEAVATAAPVADAVLGVTAADWPDPARPVLEDGADQLRAAVEDLRAARAFARDVVDALR